eukprot:CAMPEP_0177609656 /NCGR_PEP_ID=MMETSP0419_2-20121207/19234_1 /TAXON_ID=582737 /ORGANISM="Tetraselmis sp., Strain GSL018" /LENGTH=490 /DNA_ID=CAMNT_0019104653 /DNA_START=248 /DNA_END=1720 /DNA_ORIENTATION=-
MTKKDPMTRTGRFTALTMLLVAVGISVLASSWPTGVDVVDNVVQQLRTGTANSVSSSTWTRPLQRVGHFFGYNFTHTAEGDTSRACSVNNQDSRHWDARPDECCCAPEEIEELNAYDVSPALDTLIHLPFFRYFKIQLYTECPLWPDDGQCMMETCAVAECEDGEIPLPWRMAEKGEIDMDVVCLLDKGRQDGSESKQPVDTTLDAGVRMRLSHVPDWRGVSNPWMVEEEDSGDFIYVDLQRNPEKNTGYKGEHARRVWGAIYGQKCFQNITGPEACQESRVFYKLVSGVHTSITTHTMPAHLLKHRLGPEWAKPFVDNLLFSYLFTLRAVMKAGPLLKQMTYDTGNPAEDAETQRLMRSLVDSPRLQIACPVPFDEGRMWRGEGSEKKKEELRLQLHNVTRAMDCVGCDKCKMWAKLRMLGVAAAFKILFSVEDCKGEGKSNELVLERNEVIALINLLAQFSSSIEAVRTMHEVPDPPPEPEEPNVLGF